LTSCSRKIGKSVCFMRLHPESSGCTAVCAIPDLSNSLIRLSGASETLIAHAGEKSVIPLSKGIL